MDKIILDLVGKNYSYSQIARILNISKQTVYRCVKKYRVPEKKKNKLTDLMDIRLLYFCNDCDLLGNMLASTIKHQKEKKIIIHPRLINLLSENKIKKITSIVEEKNCNIKFERIYG